MLYQRGPVFEVSLKSWQIFYLSVRDVNSPQIKIVLFLFAKQRVSSPLTKTQKHVRLHWLFALVNARSLVFQAFLQGTKICHLMLRPYKNICPPKEFQQNVQSHDLIIMNCELKQCLMNLFRWANICIRPQHYDIFLYLVEMPKIPNLLHLQVQMTSEALRVSKFWSRERRLFAWQTKPHNFYLGTVYIAHREVKDLPRFQGHLENRTSYDTRLVINCQRLAPLVWPRLAESRPVFSLLGKFSWCIPKFS